MYWKHGGRGMGGRVAIDKRLFDAILRHQTMLERLKSGVFEELNKELDKLAADTREAILSLDIGKVSDLSKAELRQVAADLETIAGTRASAIADQLFGEQLPAISAAEAQFEERLLGKYFDLEIKKMASSGAAFAYARNLPSSFSGSLIGPELKRWAAREALEFGNIVRQGWTNGATIPELRNRILGTARFKRADGELIAVRRRAESLARTAIQHCSSASRQAVWENNPALVVGYRWVSTLDSRTTTQCQSLDGRVFKVGEGPTPPIHYGCRSTTVPELPEDLAFLREGATRSSLRGYVPQKTTYYEWLKDQPSAFQDAAIGPKRAALLRDGGLSLDRFSELQLGKSFQPLSLQEMRALEPQAFERAGV